MGFKQWRFPILFLLLGGALFLVFYKAFGSDPHAVPFMLQGKPAPPFTLTRLDTGETVTLESLKGKPLVLNFWASWCGPCAMEHPNLLWGARTFGDQVQFLGVVFEDTPENARAWLARHGSGFPQLIDPKSAMAVDYAVTGVPETYFIDAQGTIRSKVARPIDARTLANNVRELIGGPPEAQR